jgi:LuxR family transcriptional regulator, maltose regulon positive regulatory protein
MTEPDPDRILDLLAGGEDDTARRQLGAAFPDAPEATWSSDGMRVFALMLCASRALTEGRVDDCVTHSRAATVALPRPCPWLELRSASLLQASFRFTGDPDLHDEALNACSRIADCSDSPHVAVQARALMGSVHLLRGAYHAAIDRCDAALELAQATGLVDHAAAGLAHQFRGYVLFEWNRLHEAHAALQRAWDACGSGSNGVRSGVARMMAQLAAVRGDAGDAEMWLRRLEEIVTQPMTLRNREWLTAVRVRHRLGRGDLRDVENWLRTYEYRAAAMQDDAVILSRLHELDQVLALLELTGQWHALLELAPRVRQAAAGRRAWFETRAATSEAVALDALGRPADAADAWAAAMRSAQYGSFVRACIEGSIARRHLIERLGVRADASSRTRDLLSALRAGTSATTGDALTNKQLDVLRLVAAGHSNKAIAQQLQLALSTVKTHLRAAFQRLGAVSRTQAIAEARRRGLIGD